MKHTLSTITLLFVLLTSSVSWGSVDGKALKCGEKSSLGPFNFYPVFYEFRDSSVIGLSLMVEDGKVFLDRGFPIKYSTTTQTVEWISGYSPFQNTFVLDRKSLILTASQGSLESSKNCVVFDSKDLFGVIIPYQKEYQKQIDDEMKDNKI